MSHLTKSNDYQNNQVWSVSDFVAIFNQTIEYAYPFVSIQGELTNFKVSKNKWVYFDLKDENSSVRFFGTIYGLPGPLEDGMLVKVNGSPRLHPQFGFSVSVQSIHPVGEGEIKKAADLLQAKLQKEGLFEVSRKRPIPYPPTKVGLVASSESAAFHDFMKILNHRWTGVDIRLIDVQVQGESAPGQIVGAISELNATDVEVIIVTRGGGSPEDLAAFNHEVVVRAVATSRIPTVVAIGHEVDTCLAELAADKRASTPSNAAELLVPDKKWELANIEQISDELNRLMSVHLLNHKDAVQQSAKFLDSSLEQMVEAAKKEVMSVGSLLNSLSPKNILNRGYALVRSEDGTLISNIKKLKIGDKIAIELSDGNVAAKIIGRTNNAKFKK